ncbi:MAG: hypothetical protein ACRCSI_06455 [Eubacterium aggregans]
MTGNESSFKNGTEDKAITTPLGVGEGKQKKVTGTATYTGNASTKGQY